MLPNLSINWVTKRKQYNAMTSLVVLVFDTIGIKQPARSPVAATVKPGGEMHVLLSGTAVGDAAAATKIVGVSSPSAKMKTGRSSRSRVSSPPCPRLKRSYERPQNRRR
jgi:hypothetical protein